MRPRRALCLAALVLASGFAQSGCGERGDGADGPRPASPKHWPIVRHGQSHACDDTIPCGWRLEQTTGFPRDRPFVNPAPPLRHGDRHVAATTLPEPGVYEFASEGARRVVVAIGDDATTNTNILYSFVAGTTSGSSKGNAEFYDDREEFVRGLFRRTDVSDVSCGPTAATLGMLLEEIGVESRVIQWFSTGETPSGHQSLEVLLPDVGWTLYDPHIGLGLSPGLQRAQSLRRIRARRAA